MVFWEFRKVTGEGLHIHWITIFSTKLQNLYSFFLEKLLFYERSVSGTFLRLELLSKVFGDFPGAWADPSLCCLSWTMSTQHKIHGGRQSKNRYSDIYCPTVICINHGSIKEMCLPLGVEGYEIPV